MNDKTRLRLKVFAGLAAIVGVCGIYMSRNKRNRGGSKRGGQGKTTKGQSAPAPASVIAKSVPVTPVVVDEPKSPQTEFVTKENESDYRKETYHLERWQRNLTAALVFAAFCQVATYCWQGCEMMDQKAIMQGQMDRTDQTIDMMRLDRSANISITPPRVTDFGPGKYSKFVFQLNNSGKSRAKVTTLRYTPFFADADENLNKYLDDWGPNSGHREGLTVPTDIVKQVEFQLKELFSPVEIEHVMNRIVVHPNMGERRLYFVVDCFYTDGVDADGRTREVFYYSPGEHDPDLLRSDPRYDLAELSLRKKQAANGKQLNHDSPRLSEGIVAAILPLVECGHTDRTHDRGVILYICSQHKTVYQVSCKSLVADLATSINRPRQ